MLDDIIIKALKYDLVHSTREDKRGFNKLLDESKWLVAYPTSSEEDVKEPDEIVYDRVIFAFSNCEPEFIERGLDDIKNVSCTAEDNFWSPWKEIAVHMPGSVWIETSRIDRVYIEPVPFEYLLQLPKICYASNESFHEAIIGYLGGVNILTVDVLLEKFLNALPPERFRIEIVYDDTEDRNGIDYGNQSAVIYYNNEPFAYAKFSGRGLLSKNFFTQDEKKYKQILKEMVDSSGVLDIMSVNGATVVSTEDADLYLGVPGYTERRY